MSLHPAELLHLPLARPQPDGARLIRVLLGQERAEVPPLVEYLVDPAVRRPVVTELRRYTLPWHRRFATLAHSRGLPYFLHSCGNLDAILAVADFQARYGARIATLGGVDVEVLAHRTPAEIRAHVRSTVAVCTSRGCYAIGSGGSLPSHIPAENSMAMLDETLA